MLTCNHGIYTRQVNRMSVSVVMRLSAVTFNCREKEFNLLVTLAPPTVITGTVCSSVVCGNGTAV